MHLIRRHNHKIIIKLCIPCFAESPFSLRNKTFRQYKLSDEDIPTSIPLIIPPGYDYDPKTYSIIKHTSPSMKFALAEEAVKIIKRIDKPIAVLGICGPYRSGKSFFLSRLLGVKNAFKIGHTSKACTYGIWLSTTALICEEFVLLLIDTEGTDAVEANDKESISILTLTNLLSSFLIYNSKNVPDKNDLINIR